MRSLGTEISRSISLRGRALSCGCVIVCEPNSMPCAASDRMSAADRQARPVMKRPPIYCVLRKTVPVKPWACMIGTAVEQTSSNPSSKVMATSRSGCGVDARQ